MKHTNPPKKLQDLNLMDRFLFSELIESAEAYKIILEIILEREINFKGEPVAENEKRKELLGKILLKDAIRNGLTRMFRIWKTSEKKGKSYK